MAEEEKVATGHNNAAGLATFLVRPWVARIQPGLHRIAMSEIVVEDGERSAELRWMPKVPNAVKVDALTKCGLTSVVYAAVTVRLPSNKNRNTWSNYNAIAFYDEEDEFERSGSGFRIRLLFLEGI